MSCVGVTVCCVLGRGGPAFRGSGGLGGVVSGVGVYLVAKAVGR